MKLRKDLPMSALLITRYYKKKKTNFNHLNISDNKSFISARLELLLYHHEVRVSNLTTVHLSGRSYLVAIRFKTKHTGNVSGRKTTV